MRQGQGRRAVWSWAFYDWANSVFATCVMVGFFPVFFKQYWARDLGVTESTFWLGAASSLAALLMVLAAPLLGLWTDAAGRKRRLLAVFAGLGVLMSGGLFLVAQGQWWLALLLYGLGLVGFSGANIAYDALLPGVAGRRDLERVSALGYALGYLGGGLLLALNVAMVLSPASFGLADEAEAVRWAFLLVALWWTLFSLPVLLWVRDDAPATTSGVALSELRRTWRELRALPHAFTFLVAYWFYIDGVDTVARMAVDYGLAIGLDSGDLLGALLLTQFVGFPAAIAFGRLGERWGARRAIGLAIVVFMLVVFWAWRMQTAAEFYVLAAVIGMVLGGIQSLSRALFARLIPTDQSGRFFGLYNMLGKFAAVLGPLLVGGVAAATGSSRAGILAVSVLFLGGAILLSRVNVGEGERQAALL
ncbi:MFS transporter [endosymbiont of unidentified scaly snail isolate Monju]|uniref:MFS transporter n=1 Tax=endosymbiont of unidentified scaly snail isolate Monju TaxID=1248727 RepID=UPI0003892D86|nr:MFS transporter [endosymbiont of unidentified scaly snail isolate Monju]BAN69614.1 major facilitator transporter [endosymbiont of unidentified scaly snail isolate Monju]